MGALLCAHTRQYIFFPGRFFSLLASPLSRGLFYRVFFVAAIIVFQQFYDAIFFRRSLSLSLCNRFMNLVVVSGGEIAQNRKPMQWDCTMGDVVASHSKCQAACELND